MASQEDYNDAVAWLGGAPAAASLPTDAKLELYGIFKLLATGGGPTAPRPGMFAFEAKAKHDAWARAAETYATAARGAEEGASSAAAAAARARYLAIAASVGFRRSEGGSCDGAGADGGEPRRKPPPSGMGPSVSVMTAEDEGNVPQGTTSEVHEAAVAGAVNDLKAILLLDPAQLDSKDEFGFTPLHLAADRGHAAAVSYLLAVGADKRTLDPDGQTALEIATLSGRDDVVALLQ